MSVNMGLLKIEMTHAHIILSLGPRRNKLIHFAFLLGKSVPSPKYQREIALSLV